ncbi:MAG: hypothetical protein K2W95_22010 [Candidatus Obscuribacterales bacterium]|nr:hypothetical protein [Candidatus Obscuribacterales bacterium]
MRLRNPSLLAAILGTGLSMPAQAQVTPPTTPSTTPTNNAIRNVTVPSTTGMPSTVLPTDALPSVVELRQRTVFENLQTKMLQKLPAKLYATGTIETSFRYETNPFQFPTKRKLLRTSFPPPPIFRQLNVFQQSQFYNLLGLVNNDDVVFRALPNITVGWALTPSTRVGGNYFCIRDQLSHNTQLNTLVQSLGGFVQHDFRLSSRANLLVDLQARELLTLHQLPQFDFLPAATLSYVVTPSWVTYASGILQLRGRKPFRAPTREIDPFYTIGSVYQRRGWVFLASGTFFQSFREPFRQNAVINKDSYSIILDFEISRRVLPSIPGLQAFVRAEPIYNFHSNGTPGLAGMDFRMFWGLRMSAVKKPISSVINQIREDLEDAEQEERQKKPSPPKPSAFIPPHEMPASSPQPMHLFLNENAEADLTASSGHSEAELAASATP